MKNFISYRYLPLFVPVIILSLFMCVAPSQASNTIALNGHGTAIFLTAGNGNCLISAGKVTGSCNPATAPLTLNAQAPVGTLINWGVKNCTSTALTCTQSTATNWNIQVDPSPILGWWTLSDVAGNTVGDSSGNGNNGNLSGKATWGVDYRGTSNQAMQFDKSQFVTIPKVFSSNGVDYSIAFWIKVPLSALGGDVIDTTGNIHLQVAISNGVVRAGDAVGDQVIGKISVQDGSWHQVVITQQAASDTYTIYVDGKLDTSMPINSDKPATLMGNWTIGQNLTASLADVRVYKVVLNANEVSDLYQSNPSVSPNGSFITPTTSSGKLISVLGVWTFNGNEMYLNGNDTHGYANMMFVANGQVYALNASNQYFLYIASTGWGSSLSIVPLTENITVTASNGGTITPGPGVIQVGFGQNQTFSINAGGSAVAVTVDGNAVTLVNNQYTFQTVTAVHSINASFTIQQDTLNFSTQNACSTCSISPTGNVTLGSGSIQTVTVNYNSLAGSTTGMTPTLTLDGTVVNLSNANPATYSLTVSGNNKLVASFTSLLTAPANQQVINTLDGTAWMFGHAVNSKDYEVYFEVSGATSKIDTNGYGVMLLIFNNHAYLENQSNQWFVYSGHGWGSPISDPR